MRGEVRFDRGSRALYATDGSNYRQVPIGLVVPRDTNDVMAAVAACRRFGAPVLPRGAGTSLAGQCCNVAVVLDFTKYMNGILEIDPGRDDRRACSRAWCWTCCAIAPSSTGLTFGPDPSTHSRCSLGGMIGNNSCGTHSLLAGKTVDNVEELRVLLYDGTQLTVGATSESELAAAISQGGRRGEIYSRLRAIRDTYADLIRARYPKIPRRVSGYNLDQLLPENGFHVARALVGTEGTCVTVLEAKLRLIHSPPLPLAGRLSATATRLSRPITCRKFWSSGRLAWKVSREQSSTACAGRARPIWNCCRRGADSCWWNLARKMPRRPKRRRGG